MRDPLCDCDTTDLTHDPACARYDLTVIDAAEQAAREDGHRPVRSAE